MSHLENDAKPPALANKVLIGLLVLCCLAPFVAAVSVFVPVVEHYRTPRVVISDELIKEFVKNSRTNRHILEELYGYRTMGMHKRLPGDELVSTATEILNGYMSAPHHAAAPFALPLTFDDINSAPASMRLSLAGLLPASILLDTYKRTGNDKYLHAAADIAIWFLKSEHDMWLPQGLIWNDHAIAARSMFFCRLLVELAFVDGSDKTAVSGELLEALDRHVRLLADDRHFTFRSNHGLMQSVAVLHAAIVVPSLPSIRDNLQKVINRTDQQLELIVSTNGVFTEHSAGYQEFNLNLLAQAIRYVTLLTGSVPEHWTERYFNALEFYRHIRRPDDTLPRHGDTGGSAAPVLLGVAEPGPLRLSSESEFVAQHAEPAWFDPGLGYWSEWGTDSHLLVTWANFPSQVHKHADELSLHFWSAGEDWLTAAGYWPYGDAMREKAIGWRGSNAPHALNEPSDTLRTSTLSAWYRDDDVTLLHLQRNASSGHTVNRMLVRFGRTWLNIDAAEGDVASTTTVWQLSPTVEIANGGQVEEKRVSLLRSTQSTSSLAVQALLGNDAAMSQVRGEREPFGGWVIRAGVAQPAAAVVMTAPKGSWSGLAWRSEASSGSLPEALVRDISWESANDWSVEFGDVPPVVLERHGQQLTIRSGQSRRDISLQDVTTTSEALEMAERAYFEAAKRYPMFRDFLPWRYKIFWLAIAAAILQFIVLVAASRQLQAYPKFAIPLLSSMFLAHCVLAAWLHLVYFAPVGIHG